MLKKHLLALVALTSLGFLPMTQADEVVDDRWYVAPFGTFVQPGGDRDSNNGWGGGMGFGKMLDEHFNVELKGFYQNLSGGNEYGSSEYDWWSCGSAIFHLSRCLFALYRTRFRRHEHWP